jgi:hypothetical protein
MRITGANEELLLDYSMNIYLGSEMLTTRVILIPPKPGEHLIDTMRLLLDNRRYEKSPQKQEVLKFLIFLTGPYGRYQTKSFPDPYIKL